MGIINFFFGERSSKAYTMNLIVQRTVNEIFQQSYNTCATNCNSDIRDITIIIDNGSRVGDIVIESTCNAQTVCSMKTSLDTIASAQLSQYYARSVEAGEPGLFPGTKIAVGVNLTLQELENITTQIVQNACISTADTSIEKVTLYVGNQSQVAGYTISSSTTAAVNCIMENTAKASVTQSSRSDATAVATSTSANMLLILILAFIIIGMSFVYLKLATSKIKKQQEGMVVSEGLKKANKEDIVGIVEGYSERL